MIEYLYYGMLLISIFLIYFALRQYNGTRELMQSGIKTKAEVVDLIEVSDDEGTAFKPVFEYRDRSKNLMTFKSQVSSRPAPYKIGDKVNIIYSPESDERKVVSFWGLYRWTIILLCIASPLLIIGGGYLLYSRG
ncbi:DUF3592 domain-containing protein [Maribacter thermophilus]|uniref:DUF3592 domain-containing protein n=1 Tax=Maribacter thermophilus TaxID=1197874 RepID=UPI000B278D0B|nr:DUF3592 domain-containing protein [Maribacter thermophilus]